MGGCEACGTASICPGIATVHMLFKLRQWRDEYFWKNKTHRSTRSTPGRPVFDVKTKFAAEFTFCCV